MEFAGIIIPSFPPPADVARYDEDAPLFPPLTFLNSQGGVPFSSQRPKLLFRGFFPSLQTPVRPFPPPLAGVGDFSFSLFILDGRGFSPLFFGPGHFFFFPPFWEPQLQSPSQELGCLLFFFSGLRPHYRLFPPPPRGTAPLVSEGFPPRETPALLFCDFSFTFFFFSFPLPFPLSSR